MAELLRCIGVCMLCCCQSASEAGRCSSCTKWTIGGAIVLGLLGLCIAMGVANSDIASSDDCATLCGQDYSVLIGAACCLPSDPGNCQQREVCRDAVQKVARAWFAGCIGIGAFIGLILVGFGGVVCVQRYRKARRESLASAEKLKSLMEPDLNDCRVERPKEQSCRLCLRTLLAEAVRMGCGHEFHFGCMEAHLRSHFDCPVCHKLIKIGR